jgi:hypothetical protein
MSTKEGGGVSAVSNRVRRIVGDRLAVVHVGAHAY